jgi:hypothetical protein
LSPQKRNIPTNERQIHPHLAFAIFAPNPSPHAASAGKIAQTKRAFMKQHLSYCLFFLLFFYKGVCNVPLFAQDWNEVQKKETFQLSDSLEREMLLARKPLLAYGYYVHKALGVSHGMITGHASFNYLPVGLPGISETNTPLLQPTFGFGVKIFLGNIFYSLIFDVGRTVWQLPPEAPAKTVRLNSLNSGMDIGYAVVKTNNFFLTPCVNLALSGYTFDTTSSWKIFTGRHNLGGAVDMSYFVPIAASPFQSLEERKVGMKEIIEAMISLRIGYAQSFEGGTSFFATPTHQEFSVRLTVGIGSSKFIEDF